MAKMHATNIANITFTLLYISLAICRKKSPTVVFPAMGFKLFANLL